MPPVFCTGSMITMATVSGPASTIARSTSSAQASEQADCWAQNPQRYRLVLAALRAQGSSGSNGSRMPGMPVMLSAPKVVPWYA